MTEEATTETAPEATESPPAEERSPIDIRLSQMDRIREASRRAELGFAPEILVPEEPAPAEDSQPAPAEPQETVAEGEAQEDTEKRDAPPEFDPKKAAPEFRRMRKQREKLQAERRELQKLQAAHADAVAEHKARMGQLEELEKLAKEDAAGFLARQGVTPESWAKSHLQLEAQSPEAKQIAEQSKQIAELTELVQQLKGGRDEELKEREQAQAQAGYQNDLKVIGQRFSEVSETYPLLAKSDPDKVRFESYQLIKQYKEETGVLPDFSEVFDHLEGKLSQALKRYNVAESAKKPTPVAESPEKTSETLTPAASSGTPPPSGLEDRATRLRRAAAALNR